MIDIQSSFEFQNYKEDVPVRGMIISQNRFLKVRMLGADYYFSVLPGFHNSTLEELDFKIKHFFSTYELNFNLINFSKRYFNTIPESKLPDTPTAEVLFVIETLILGILKKTHPGLFSSREIKINELYRPAKGPGHYVTSQCLKIKISPASVDKSIRLINELYRLNEKLLLRLDGNRLFEIKEMIEFEVTLKKNIPPLAFANIDYIEEPFKNFSDTYLFLKRSELSIAMDESFIQLMQLSDDNFPKDIPAVAKPSLTGISSIYNWMQIHTKKRMIISSSFEHPTVKIGLDFLAGERPSEFHGLEKFL